MTYKEVRSCLNEIFFASNVFNIGKDKNICYQVEARELPGKQSIIMVRRMEIQKIITFKGYQDTNFWLFYIHESEELLEKQFNEFITILEEDRLIDKMKDTNFYEIIF